MPTLTTESGVHVLTLGDDENRFGPDWLTAAEQALDQVIANPAPLVTVAYGKFYSNGLDLEWVMSHNDQFEAYAARVEALLARILTLPVPTVAAVNGHAFGAGAMFAIAHDWRIMRSDRGYFCFPEVDINIPFTPGMAALIQAKLTPRSAVDSMTTGRRFTGPDALAVGLVDGIADEASLLTDARTKLADLHAKSGDTLGAIKTTMFADVVRTLTKASAKDE
jgi:enoyl-CoA hydratase/carnithine racemase